MIKSRNLLFPLLILLSTLACSRVARPAATVAGAALNQATLTSPPTAISSPIPSPLFPFPSFTLQQELYFALGGGVPSVGAQGDCLNLAPAAFPAIRDSGRNTVDPLFKDYSSVCLYGFPLDQTLLVSVFRPDGSGAGSAGFFFQRWAPGERFGFLMRMEGDKARVAGSVHKQAIGWIMELPLWLPPGLPEGEWRLEVRSGGVLTSGAFTVGPRRDAPSLDLAFDPPASPLSRPGIYSVSWGLDCPAYKAGEQVYLHLSHLPSEGIFPVGLYLGNNLVRQGVVASDGQGQSTYSLQILPTDPPGDYMVIVVLDANVQDPAKAGPYACLEVIP